MTQHDTNRPGMAPASPSSEGRGEGGAGSRAFELVLFDLDGTLIDTAPEIADAVNDTLARFDLPRLSVARVTGWIGHGTHELLVQALAAQGETGAAIVRGSESLRLAGLEFGRFYLARCGTRSTLYPQVRETLAALRARGVALALVTNKEARFAQRLLAAHGLDAAFDRVIGGDTLPTKKPDPAGVQACLAQFGVNVERALFVGDSAIDVATARAAGVQVWAVPYGYNQGHPIAASAPDRLIDDIAALL
jgi:phosphoglycolate phosphatase